MSILDKLYDEKNAKPEPVKIEAPKKEARAKIYPRTIGDLFTITEAQRVFNPGMPPTKPKGPPAAQVEAGTSGALDLTGSWGTPNG